MAERGRTTIDDLLRAARARLDRLEPQEALAEQRDGALIVDTRSSDQRRRAGIIPDSLHVPRSVLEWRLDPDADPEFHNPHIRGLGQRLILVCADGYSSSLAAATLRDLGFDRATDLAGGFSAWKEQGLPVVPAPPETPGVQGLGDPDGTGG
jgi:rhodanese-related sulfurtransferase